MSSNTTTQKKATINQTTLNIAKACMGTGTLALPYAACQGGLLLNTFGLALVSMWNLYSVDRLMHCLELLPEDAFDDGGLPGGEGIVLLQQQSPTVPTNGNKQKKGHRRTASAMRRLFRKTPSKRIPIDERRVNYYDDDDDDDNGGVHGLLGWNTDRIRRCFSSENRPPPAGTATFGKVAWYTLGPFGLKTLDLLMVILLLGILIAYEDAIISFVHDTPFTTGSAALDSIWTVLIIGPLSCVPNMHYLARFSAVGIFAIFCTFGVVAGYGIADNGLATGFRRISRDRLWPRGIAGASNWFGVVAFGFGVVPIAYNIQESMEEPRHMTRATEKALWAVFVSYVIIGDGVSILYSPAVDTFEGDVLQVLPDSWIPTAVRLAMTFVVLVTAPLLVVPCGELIEGKIGFGSGSPFVWRAVVRIVICLFCTGVSVLVPGFVHVISFVGCFCVALVGFIFPPLFHLLLMQRRSEKPPGTPIDMSQEKCYSFGRVLDPNATYLDVAMLIWGITATTMTSIFTFLNLLEHAA